MSELTDRMRSWKSSAPEALDMMSEAANLIDKYETERTRAKKFVIAKYGNKGSGPILRSTCMMQARMIESLSDLVTESKNALVETKSCIETIMQGPDNSKLIGKIDELLTETEKEWIKKGLDNAPR